MATSRPAAPEPQAAALDLPLKTAIARLANGVSPASLGLAHFDWLLHLAVSPSKQAELASSALRKNLLWWQYLGACARGQGASCVAPVADDRRFSRPEWQAPPFGALAQGFLLAQQWWEEATHGVRGVSRHHEQVAAFTVRQWLDMLSPSNVPWLNPQVLRQAAASGGLNFAQGIANWARDAMAVATDGRPRGVEAFRPGEGVALTPGRVVHRNRLCELIQYEPTTPKVAREPVLLVPSWIMKFYILDLTPQDSLVKYLVDQGHTVFVVSWRNPHTADRALTLDDYLDLGVLASLDHVRSACGDVPVHAAGYCLGGTLLAMAAAVLGARKSQVLKTVTLLAGLVDFEQPGELGLFIDESQVAFLEDLMAEPGYLDGRRMAGAFQLLNSRDLVWSKLLHEYLMGAQTPMTAMRAWNADQTRMPARMHSEYLRRLYLDNELAEGDYPVHGQAVNLRAIRVPLFVLATERDHVAPWQSVYKVLRLVGGPTRFVLASGGHNVGIVSPPAGPSAHAEASYRWAEHGVDAAPPDPLAWHARARQEAGSWWPCWEQWLRSHGSGEVAAPAVPRVRMAGAVVAAPGSYVFEE
ncbi:polyhydroxyalkanoic acid synthase [Ramlibacter sp. USB13]|uniref:Polyhydroxyalkanoic acid synthase n=1 Tax=Ramlibacter cellulosilyticus TaxID=2764187 RepID=A0A923MR72_9BURK|nr:alpha/beta fold hydrolase [Ramlibacter cellulosilyticus]MBC5783471.1 polyhydroxyalkanoic acid synthase [Ramlibacter cellulosilyticus]